MGLFPLNEIHTIIKDEIGLEIMADGLQDESAPLPYIQFSEIGFDFSAPYQIVKSYDEETPSTSKTDYTNFQQFDYMYSIVSESREVKKSYELLRSLYNYLTTDTFMLLMDNINVGFNVASNIEIIKINVQQFIERRMQFEINYFYSDNFTKIENTFIKTADIERVESAEGA